MGRDITNNGNIEGDCITGDKIINISFKSGGETHSGVDGLPARLYKAMRNKRLSAFQLEKKIGISKFLICQYLDGTIEPSLKNIAMLADSLCVSLDWLISGRSDSFNLKRRIEDLERLVFNNGGL